MNKYLLILCLLILSLSVNALSITNTKSGSWYDASIWDAGRIPSTLDVVTIASGTTVTVYGTYTDCDALTINGFLDVGPTNLTIGGRDLQIDVRAVRNAYVVVNGRLRINGDWSTQFKVYGYVKFNTGSIFDMLAGQMMIDGCAFTEELSVTADHALLDVTDAASINTTGGVINMFNAHYHPTGLTIKGAKHFYSVSFGNNLILPNFAQRHTSDFKISETDKPTFSSIRVAYLPNPNYQNKVILNDIAIDGNLDVSNGVIIGTGRLKVGGNLLIAADGRIERDIECNGTWQQNITSYLGNSAITIKGNVFINNPNLVQANLDINIQNGTLQMMQGRFDASNKTITLSSAPVNADASKYIITQNGGSLVVKNISGATLFPVGTADSYLPVTLTASSGDFSVAARPLSIGTGSDNFALNNQWEINRLSGNATADIQVKWRAANETTNFTTYRQNARLHHYNGSTWQAHGTTGVSFADPFYAKSAENINEFSTFTVMTQTVVPITLKSFTAKSVNNEAHLLWQTATELNNAGFVIEKSIDGSTFSNIGFVKGAGNVFDLKNYEFIDANFDKTSYYRLKQVDFDNQFFYSPIVSLQYKAEKGTVKIYPNPMTNQSTLTVSQTENTQNLSKIAIYDTSGRIVYQNASLNNQNTVKIPVQNWAKGLYLIHITSGNKTTVEKFVKN
jgi:hypothetical protein